MLVTLGRRNPPEDLVGLLLECHQRIRTFIDLAQVVGRHEGPTTPDLIDACRRCERYFSQALPLHVEDEEESLLPRLRGASREIDDALAIMRTQHEEHESQVVALLEALHSVANDANDHSGRRRLHAIAEQLAGDFEQHLTMEEQVVFPAIHVLPEEERAAVIAELRARRQQSP
jgi:iron-sulfur cluster repair protein YtfE (RIC family)